MKNKYYYILLISFLLSSTVDNVYSQDKLNNKSDKRLALEIPLSITKSFILIEAQLDKYIDVKEKLSQDFGLGLRFSATDKIRLRLGFHHWNLPINPSYEAIALDENNNEITINVEEESHLRNSSIYFHLNYEGNHAFIGGGFNIGVSNNYKTKLSYYDESGTFIFSESGTKSIITDEFENQTHIEIIGGLKFNTSTVFAFKPFIKASLPVKPIYDSKTPDNTAYDMFAILINFGLIVDIGMLDF
jgi:hypothetical protein